MGSRTYTKLTALVKRWPNELFVSEKQLGDHIKKTVLEAYASGTVSAIDEAKLERLYESCNRLVNNTHKTKYVRLYADCTATGIETKIPPDTKINVDELSQYDDDDESRTPLAKLKNSLPFTKQHKE